MLTLRKTRTAPILSLDLQDEAVEDLLAQEWLLTNTRGGYASSTVAGCNTRGYHGLLIGSLQMPVCRPWLAVWRESGARCTLRIRPTVVFTPWTRLH